MSNTNYYSVASDKYKVSISVDEQTLVLIREQIRSGRYRNRSHAFESAIKDLLGGSK